MRDASTLQRSASSECGTTSEELARLLDTGIIDGSLLQATLGQTRPFLTGPHLANGCSETIRPSR